MNKLHIIGIVAVAVCIGAIMSTFSESLEYASFSEAAKQPERTYHVVGQLTRVKDMIYQPKINPNQFTFYMLDKDRQEKCVVLHKSKPQDFEKSEQIVIIGQNGEDCFHAKDVLMKCPSKYNQQNQLE